MSQLFTSGGQSFGASASVLPMHIQDWFPLGLTGLISLQSKGLSRVFSNTTVWKPQFGKKQIQPRESFFFIAGLIRAFSLLLCIVNIKEFNCQNLEATRMACKRWMNKQTVVHPENGMLVHGEKKWAIKPRKRHGGNFKDILLNERSQSEQATYDVVATIWHSGEGRTTETIRRSWVPGVWREKMTNKWSTGIFRAMKLFYMSLKW